MKRDSLGRRRTPAQTAGLRSLFPPLGPDLVSRALRVAMSPAAWARLDRLTASRQAPTAPRAVGRIIERALEEQAVLDWQEWQIRKERRLLARHADAAAAS